jgi:hypothetical protein
MALTPFSCDIMGWRGAGGNSAASTSVITLALQSYETPPADSALVAVDHTTS